MATFDEQFFVHEASPLKRVWRDIRLLGFFATIVWRWLWQGQNGRTWREGAEIP